MAVKGIEMKIRRLRPDEGWMTHPRYIANVAAMKKLDDMYKFGKRVTWKQRVCSTIEG